MGRLVVVSNRIADPRKPAAGGLAVALGEALQTTGGLWFGWSGKSVREASGEVHEQVDGNIRYVTVDLNRADLDAYYNGFSNRTLWPLLHFRLDLVDYDRATREGYRRVNALFADKLAPRLRRIRPGILLGGPVTCNPNLGWARELLRENLKEVDFLSYHQYGYSEPFDTPDRFVMARTVRYREAAEEYRKLAREFGKELPVIVSEANTNPRYHNPPGTDPRIRTAFGAAWYFSALCRFAQGGGDALCFFTLDGGFGACHALKKGLTLYPVYHTIWLFRRVADGAESIVPLASTSPDVEAYAFGSRGLAVVNKSGGEIDVELSGVAGGDCREYILNETGAAACRYLTPEGEIPTLPARVGAPPARFRMAPFEVRVRIRNVENDRKTGEHHAR